MTQWGKCNVKYGMERSIFTIYGSLYWWKKYGMVGWENSALSKTALYREIETWDPLVERETV